MKRGFTLIELLVVVAIIAVLVAILMPSLSNARRQAKTVACSSQMRQIGIAFTMYQSENMGAIPDLVYGYSTVSSASKAINITNESLYTDRPWDYLLLPYLNNSRNNAPKVFRCPVDETRRTYASSNNPTQSYVLNREYAGFADPMPDDAGSPANKKITMIPNQGDLILLTCFANAWSRKNPGEIPIVGLSDKFGYSYTTLHYSPNSYSTPPYLFMNHSDGSNYLKCDGHVEWQKNANMLGYHQGIAGDKPSKSQWRIRN